jgi:hypothetical protein
VKVGGQLQGAGPNGPVVYNVVKIKGPEVHLDGNHALAGQAHPLCRHREGGARRHRRGNRARPRARRARASPLIRGAAEWAPEVTASLSRCCRGCRFRGDDGVFCRPGARSITPPFLRLIQ